MTLFYGVGSQLELVKHIMRACEIISPRTTVVSKNLLIETCAVETGIGTIRDEYEAQGRGILQFDIVGFDDTQKRFGGKYPEIVAELAEHLGIHWHCVTFEMLEYAPLLSAVFCRAKYYLVPHAIPNTRAERAQYWKTWYNSELGAGTVEHYLEMADRHVGIEI